MNPKLHKANLRKMARYMKALPPNKFHQGTWCGTPCCVGGHTVMHLGTDEEKAAYMVLEREDFSPDNFSVEEAADRILFRGTPDAGWTTRLYDTKWPAQYTDNYCQPTTTGAAKFLLDLANEKVNLEEAE
jgi:hypothetical protein